MNQERLTDLQYSLNLYKTATFNELLMDARRFTSSEITEIEKCAFEKARHYSAMEEDEKKFLKGKIKKGVVFNLGLLGVYKVLTNPGVFGINMRIFGKIVKFLTFKKGVFLWILSPLMAHYDY